MRGMIFTLRVKPQQPLDLSMLTPDRLATAGSLREIARIKLYVNGATARLDDVFSISGDDPEDIELRRTTGWATRIGAQMTRGRIRVNAQGGSHLGEGMRGGLIRVAGDCGDWLGCNMVNGRIEVNGNAGDYIGAGTRDSRHGMANGVLTVWGNAGHRSGMEMRRGIILIGGNAGDFSGAGMLAGSLLILGKCGRLPGYGMRRGSIMLGCKPEYMGSTMAPCGLLKMEYLRLFFKQLSLMGKRYRFLRNLGPEAYLYNGDTANQGKGELMVLLDQTRHTASE